jgi:hypothetical protein
LIDHIRSDLFLGMVDGTFEALTDSEIVEYVLANPYAEPTDAPDCDSGRGSSDGEESQGRDSYGLGGSGGGGGQPRGGGGATPGGESLGDAERGENSCDPLGATPWPRQAHRYPLWPNPLEGR